MKLLSIASGSSGNCIYVGDKKTNLLIDAGISGKRIESGLEENNISIEKIKGILVTHEHLDHVSSLGILARRYHIPIYATKETIKELCQMKNLGKIPYDLFHPITADIDFQIEDLTIHPFSISHDAVNPVAYRVSNKTKSVAVATDMGTYDNYTIHNLKVLDAIIIEANHDVNMLEIGKYPYQLKKRILGEKGHLSNEGSGKLLCEIVSEKLKYVFLGHMSKENNYEALAYETVKLELAISNRKYFDSGFCLQVAKRDKPSALITI